MLLAFHLGRVYTLSLAEILAVLNRRGVAYSIRDLYTEILVLETKQDLDLESLQKRLGGVIKIMKVVDAVPRKKKTDYVSFSLRDYFSTSRLKEQYLGQRNGKLQFGVSLYPLSADLKLHGQNKRIGMEIKSTLTESGASCRLVLPERNSISLPSVSVTNNHLLEKGAEIDLLVSDKQILIAKTVTVQDFADYGRRDYQRPVRDMRMGMLPPKVAQMMINLAEYEPQERDTHAVMLDPFCGVGTLLQEAMLIGFKVVGSDISPKAVEGAEKNLNWFRIRYKLPPARYELFTSDAGKISEQFSEQKPIAVVTEGTLGPAYDEVPDQKQIDKNFKDISQIHTAAFKEIKKILEPGRTVVMALPAYKTKNSYITYPGIDKILALGYDIQAPIPEAIQKAYPFLKITPRNSIIYDRKDQVVVREIVIFKVKKKR